VLSPVLLLGLCAFDRAYFASNYRQRAILRDYYPEVDCSDADFDLVEREDTLLDWRYVVRISGSQTCLQSLRRALLRRGFVNRHDIEPMGLQPQRQSSQKEVVGFDFDREPGAVYWTRDKT
jgi:hypothetical protein